MLEQDRKILQEKANMPEGVFAKKYPDIYERVVESTKMHAGAGWNERKYIYVNQIKERPTCKICGKMVCFKSAKRGYKATCSRECDLALKSQTQKENKRKRDAQK